MSGRGRPAIARAAPYILIAAALGVATAAVILPTDDSQPEPAPDLELTANKRSTLGLKTSRRGSPILTAPRLVPGESASGRIKVRNRGAHTLRLKLIRRRLIDRPGPQGGRLSDALTVQIHRMRGKGRSRRRARPVYSGPVTKLRRVRLRRLQPGAKQRYRFVVAMREGGIPSSPASGDNAFQGSSASVDFVWRGVPAR